MSEWTHPVHETLAAQRQTAIWRNRFSTLFDRTPMPTVICPLDGVITAANPAFADLLDTSTTRLRGRQITTVLHPRRQRDYERVVRDLEADRRSRHVFAVHFAPGRTGRVDVQSVPDEDGLGLLLTVWPDPPAPYDGIELTGREAHILSAVAAGDTSAAIAERLGLTADGVSYHLTRLTSRFGVPNRTALVARAYTLGLLDPTSWPPEHGVPS